MTTPGFGVISGRVFLPCPHAGRYYRDPNGFMVQLQRQVRA